MMGRRFVMILLLIFPVLSLSGIERDATELPEVLCLCLLCLFVLFVCLFVAPRKVDSRECKYLEFYEKWRFNCLDFYEK